MSEITYSANDENLNAAEFLGLAQKTWPGDYDSVATARALVRTVNTTARDKNKLIGCVRVLTDGYFFGTIPEILIDPDYQGMGIGRQLMQLAFDESPTSLFFGAQPGKERFYEKLGYEPGLQSYYRKKPRE